MAKKLKVGIIGLGGIGTVHADALTATAEAELVALCDIDAPRLQAQGARLGVKGLFDDYRKLLKSAAEAVYVCVPNALHAEMAVAALGAGKHVFLEKPTALNARQAAQIAAAARKSRGLIQVGMVWRQAPQAQIVREYVEAGLFGRVHHLRAVMIRRRGIPGMGGWFTTKRLSGGGPMIDLGVHWFDLSMWLSGHWKPTAASAKTYAKFGPNMRQYKYVGMWAGPPKFDGTFDVEDYSTGFVRFGDQATLSFEIAWATNAESESFIDVVGERGGARLYEAKPLVIFTEHQGRLADITPKYNENVNRFQIQAGKFIAACRGEAPPAATIEQGVTVMKLIDAIYKSSAENREVAIK